MQKGYCLTAGSRLYFMATNTTKKTKNMVVEFIDKYCHKTGICADLIERCKVDESTIKEVQKRLEPCTLELKSAGEVEYYHIEGNNFTENVPLTDNCVFIL